MILKPVDMRSEDGTAAIEFAMIAPVFVALLFSMFEVGILLLKTSTLDDAVARSARLVYTGQAPTKASLEQAICDHVALVSDCTENINVELIAAAGFEDVPSQETECRDSSNAGFEPVTRYAAVQSAQIVFMRVCLTTDIITPGVGVGLSLPKTESGRLQIVATTAFMSEPF